MSTNQPLDLTVIPPGAKPANLRREMSPSKLRHTLRSLGLSQAGASRLLGVTDRAVQMWVAGDRSVPDWVSRALRLMAAGTLKPDDWRDA
jgi:DNA-binding transcriptional regulator YiaG